MRVEHIGPSRPLWCELYGIGIGELASVVRKNNGEQRGEVLMAQGLIKPSEDLLDAFACVPLPDICELEVA